MPQFFIILAVIGGGVFGARFFPTEEMLQDRFALGQKYYAANDHDNSVQVFGQIEKTPNYALLNVDQIEVSVGELTLPLRVAATYQLGNSYRNVGLAKLERSRNALAEGDSALADQRLKEAEAAFSAGKQYYRRLVEDQANAPMGVRTMAFYQIVRSSYQMGNYAAVVDEVGEMLERFPQSEYKVAALYDQGWAEYYMAKYSAAIQTFGRLLAVADDALKTDRALFQTGESYFALADYEAARSWYRKLVAKYDFSALTEKELQEMKTQRLRGLVQETTRELVAKAQIRIGDAFAAEKRVDEAIQAYSQVPSRYPQEDLLVQKSFDNMAGMVLEQQGTDAGIQVLRRAIEQVADPIFRGRAQLKIARTLYADGRYQAAIDEYRVYKRAYGEWAVRIGVPLDQVDFVVAEAYRELARQDAPEANYARAAELYRDVLGQPRSQRHAEAQYGLGHALYGLGRHEQASQAFAIVGQRHADHPVAPYALNWQARLAFAGGDDDQAVALYRRLIENYPASGFAATAWKDLGLVYKKMGRLEEAIDAFGRVGPETPAWIKVQAEAGDMLLAAGRLDEIERRFDLPGAVERARQRGDNETLAELYYIQGRIARERQDPAGEIAALSAALEHSANDQLEAFAHFFRGLSRYRLATQADATGDTLNGSRYFLAAVEDLERVLEADAAPDLRAVAYRTRGVALTRLGRSAEAVETYRILIEAATTPQERSEFELMLMELYYDQGQLDQTEAVARRLLDGQAEASAKERALIVLVSLQLEQERYADALETAQTAQRRYPDSDHLATLRSVQARSLFFLERYEEAAAAFGRFIEAHPDHPEVVSALYQKGYCHEILGQYEAAATAFLALADRAGDDALTPDALYRAGENLYNVSAFQRALAVYLRLIEAYPQSEFAPKALYSASWTYMDMEREDDSIAAMQRLAAEYPDSEFARYALFSVGDFYYSQKQYEPAQETYRRVVERYAGTPEADKAAQLIVDLDEDLASQAYDEVFALFEGGNYATAADGFDRIFQQYPGSYSALAALANKAVALERLGNSDEARSTYRQVIAQAADDPENAPLVEFAQLRLDNL